MERRIRIGSGFRAQGAIERKFPNGNPDVTDWFRLGKGGSRNFARERMENVATVGTDIQETPEVSGSIRSADKGTETTSLAPRVTRSATKQTPGSSPRPKRAYVSPSKGSSSKRRR